MILQPLVLLHYWNYTFIFIKNVMHHLNDTVQHHKGLQQ
jgi:hypothetical protein